MKEIWKDIEGYEGRYKVSNLGNVMTMKYKGKGNARILKPYKNKYGYLMVGLYNKPKNIHRLVAKAFIPNIECKPEVNHIDGNKRNNCVNNLEWCNRSENQRHAFRTGLNKARHGSDNILSRKVLQIDKENKTIINEYSSMKEAELATGIRYENISACCRGERKSRGGYIWKYKDE